MLFLHIVSVCSVVCVRDRDEMEAQGQTFASQQLRGIICVDGCGGSCVASWVIQESRHLYARAEVTESVCFRVLRIPRLHADRCCSLPRLPGTFWCSQTGPSDRGNPWWRGAVGGVEVGPLDCSDRSLEGPRRVRLRLGAILVSFKRLLELPRPATSRKQEARSACDSFSASSEPHWLVGVACRANRHGQRHCVGTWS